MSTEIQQTLVLVKPDGVQRGLIGPIVTRLEARGLKIVAMKMLQLDMEAASRHYRAHKERPFFLDSWGSLLPAPLWPWS